MTVPDLLSSSYRPSDLPDPPYVAGDHFATCRGCPDCARLEDAYFARELAKRARPCIAARERRDP